MTSTCTQGITKITIRHPRVAEDLDELLDQHVLDAFEHASVSSQCFRCCDTRSNYVNFFFNFTLANNTMTTP